MFSHAPRVLGRRAVVGALIVGPVLLGLSACADSDSFEFKPSGRCGRGCVGATDHEKDSEARRSGLDQAKAAKEASQGS
ncbi:MAG: hypothetical protein OXG64_07055 [Chloroflexi bacterium]|nr:hypothetical protein [Chloroflexota bacterium]MCY3957988.1 hypothetical protein [Chloroflexota bacterium]